MKSLFIILRLVLQYKLGTLRPCCRKGRRLNFSCAGPAQPPLRLARPTGIGRPGPSLSRRGCDEPPTNLSGKLGPGALAAGPAGHRG